jgi:hypothetical protein
VRPATGHRAQVRLDQVVRHLEKLHDVIEVNERTETDVALFEPSRWREGAAPSESR